MYQIYGYKPTTHESNADTPESQKAPPEVVLYETDDREEVKQIAAVMGWVDGNGQWHAVSRVVNTNKVTTTAGPDLASKRVADNTTDTPTVSKEEADAPFRKPAGQPGPLRKGDV